MFKSLPERWFMILMAKIKDRPGALKGNSLYKPFPQSAIKTTKRLAPVANTAYIRCSWLYTCITWLTSVILQASITHIVFPAFITVYFV